MTGPVFVPKDSVFYCMNCRHLWVAEKDYLEDDWRAFGAIDGGLAIPQCPICGPTDSFRISHYIQAMHFAYDQPRSVKKALRKDWATINIRADPLFDEAINKYDYERKSMVVTANLGGFGLEYNLGKEPARGPSGWLLSPYTYLIFKDDHLVGYGSHRVRIIKPLEAEMKGLLKSTWKALEAKRR